MDNKYNSDNNVSAMTGYVVPSKMKEVPDVLEDLEVIVDYMGKTTESLYLRLKVLLNESKLEKETDEIKAKTYGSEFASKLNEDANKLRAIQNRLNYLLERLEI